MTVVSAQTYKVEQFRGYHVPGKPFVLFNVWDAGSAKSVADAGAKAIATWLTTAAKVCHLDRPRGSEATECEWRDPENAYTTMLMQGISTRTFSPTPNVPASVVRAAWGERLGSAWQRTPGRDFSTTSSVASAPSVSARNDRCCE